MAINFNALVEAEADDFGPVELTAAERVEVARVGIEEFKKEISRVVKEAREIEIRDADTKARASLLGSTAQGILKKVEGKRDEFIKEPEGFVRAVKNMAAEIIAPLKEIKVLLGTKISNFSQAEELKRQEAERAARAEAARLQAQLDAEAKEKDLTPVTVATPMIPKKSGTTRTAAGTSFSRAGWDFEVVNFAAVPDEYKATNDKAIRDAIKMGKRGGDIPGLRIFEKPSTGFRAV